MFENMTYEFILKRALSLVSNNIDKRQGSIIYDALAPACAELAQMYISLDNFLNQTFADTADREYLIRRAAERGLTPKSASPAVMKGEFNIDVPIGSRFSINNLIFYADEKISENCYRLVCETLGTIGHRAFGNLIPLDNIKDLTKAVITEVIITGEDEETTENFRKRYFDSFNSLAFGGNKKDYIEKVNSISGVGGCKVIPVFNGGGTVKVIVISSDYTIPSEEFLKEVKEMADPEKTTGNGDGFAPIGHKVTVVGVRECNITINIELTYENGYKLEDISEYVINEINDYMKELAVKWADSENTEIIAMRIGTDIFNINGIKSISEITINNLNPFDNLIIDMDCIPVLRELIINGNKIEVN